MKVIFLHIPKAAGTTFNQVLDREYKNKSIYQLNYNDVPNFKKLTISELNKIDVLRGHIPFGLHECFSQKSTYITFLRDPIKRVISYYYYVCNTPKHYLYDRVKSQNISLEEFVDSDLTGEIENGQIRFLIAKNKLADSIDKESLKQAKLNLENYFQFGITEAFDESLLYLSTQLKWENSPFYIKENVSKTKRSIEEHIIKKIQKRNELDIELYNWANSLFQEKCSNINIFDQKLVSFQEGNKKYLNSWEAKMIKTKESAKRVLKKSINWS